MLVYVAGPIDFSGENSLVKTVRAGILEVAAEKGWCTFDPSAAFTVCGSPNDRIQRINKFAIDTADAVMAFLIGGVVSLGTPMEIQYAIDSDKPVAVVTNVESWALVGAGIPIYSFHSTEHLQEDIELAFDHLGEGFE